jgi:hypothetical protein
MVDDPGWAVNSGSVAAKTYGLQEVLWVMRDSTVPGLLLAIFQRQSSFYPVVR